MRDEKTAMNQNIIEGEKVIGNQKALENQNAIGNQKVMENQKAIENRKEDKKAFKKFIVIIIVSGLVGGVVGYTSAGTVEVQKRAAELLLSATRIVAPFGNVILATVMLIALSLLLRHCKKSFAGWDGEEETLIDGIERKLSCGLIATSIYTGISFFLFGAGVYVLDIAKAGRNMPWKGVAVTLLGVVYAMVVIVFFQKEIINFTKEINPEKHGSVYDARFQKKWLESCDELERLQAYKACYKAYNAVNYTCMGLWVFTTIGIMIWDFGMVPMMMVMIIWLVAVGTYGAACIRLTKNPSELREQEGER